MSDLEWLAIEGVHDPPSEDLTRSEGHPESMRLSEGLGGGICLCSYLCSAFSFWPGEIMWLWAKTYTKLLWDLSISVYAPLRCNHLPAAAELTGKSHGPCLRGPYYAPRMCESTDICYHLGGTSADVERLMMESNAYIPDSPYKQSQTRSIDVIYAWEHKHILEMEGGGQPQKEPWGRSQTKGKHPPLVDAGDSCWVSQLQTSWTSCEKKGMPHGDKCSSQSKATSYFLWEDPRGLSSKSPQRTSILEGKEAYKLLRLRTEWQPPFYWLPGSSLSRAPTPHPTHPMLQEEGSRCQPFLTRSKPLSTLLQPIWSHGWRKDLQQRLGERWRHHKLKDVTLIHYLQGPMVAYDTSPHAAPGIPGGSSDYSACGGGGGGSPWRHSQSPWSA